MDKIIACSWGWLGYVGLVTHNAFLQFHHACRTGDCSLKIIKRFLFFPSHKYIFFLGSGLADYVTICLLLTRGRGTKRSRKRNIEMSLTRAGIRWEIWVAGCFDLTLASLLAEVFTPTVLHPDTDTIPPVWLMHCSAAGLEDVSRRSPSPFQYSSLIFH